MANVCCDDVFFFSDDNRVGLDALWLDLHSSIVPGYKEDLGHIKRLFLHTGLSAVGIALHGTVTKMERNGDDILLSLDTSWRPLYNAYAAIAAHYRVQFVMQSVEPGYGIYYNTDETGIFFRDHYCVTGDISITVPCGKPLENEISYGAGFPSEDALLEKFQKLGYEAKTLETLASTLDEQGVYIHSFINPYQ